MADSFTLTPQGPTAPAGSTQAVLGAMGTTGGNSQGGVSRIESSAGNNGPDNALPAFFNTLMGDKIAATKRNRFYQGFAAARAGKSLSDIHKDQPWYVKAFGDTDYDAGATVYTAQAATAELATQMYDDMDNLKTKTPEEMGKWMSDKSAAMLTGDAMADAVIQKSFLEQSGPMLAQQAKANFAWKQETLNTGQYNNAMSQARSYQAGARNAWQLGHNGPDSQPNPMDEAEMLRPLQQALTRPQGQTDASMEANVERIATGMAREGLWHSLEAARHIVNWDALPGDAQERIEKKIDSAHTAFVNKKMMEPGYGTAAAQVAVGLASGSMSAQQGFDAYGALNARYQSETGDPLPLIPMSKIESGAVTAGTAALRMRQTNLEHAMRLDEAAAARAAVKQDKIDENNYTNRVLVQAVSDHSIATLKGMPGVTNDKIDDTMQMLMQAQPDRVPELLTGIMFFPGRGYKSEAVKQQIENNVKQSAGEVWTPAFEKQADLWRAMTSYRMEMPPAVKGGEPRVDSTSGKAAAQEYFGEYATRMARYVAGMRVPNADPKVEYLKAFGAGQQLNTVHEVSADAATTAQSALETAISSKDDAAWYKPFTAGLSDSAKAQAINMATKLYNDGRAADPGASPGDLAKNALQRMQANGAEFHGLYFWKNMTGGGSFDAAGRSIPQVPAATAMSLVTHDPKGYSPDVFSKAFGAVVQDRVKKSLGVDMTGSTSNNIVRLPDSKDVGPQFGVTVYTDGVEHTLVINGKDIEDMREHNFKQGGTDAEVAQKKWEDEMRTARY